MTEYHDDNAPRPPTIREWELLQSDIRSLARTIRGHPDEGHTGLMGRVRRLERGLYTLLGAVLVLAIENAPDFLDWLGAVFLP